MNGVLKAVAICLAIAFVGPAEGQALSQAIRNAGGPVEIPGNPTGPIVCALIPVCSVDPDTVRKVQRAVHDRSLSSFLSNGDGYFDQLFQSTNSAKVDRCVGDQGCKAMLKDWTVVTLGLSQYSLGPTPSVRLTPDDLSHVLPNGSAALKCVNDPTCADAGDGVVNWLTH